MTPIKLTAKQAQGMVTSTTRLIEERYDVQIWKTICQRFSKNAEAVPTKPRSHESNAFPQKSKRAHQITKVPIMRGKRSFFSGKFREHRSFTFLNTSATTSIQRQTYVQGWQKKNGGQLQQKWIKPINSLTFLSMSSPSLLAIQQSKILRIGKGSNWYPKNFIVQL